MFPSSLRHAAAACLTLIAAHAGTASAAEPGPAFFEAALCQPPYTTKTASDLYDAAAKHGRADNGGLSALYKLPSPIEKDGFKADEVVFVKNTFGVMLAGAQADKLAKRFRLSPEKPSVLRGAITKGYGRALEAKLQPSPERGVVSIVAREDASLPGKTMLACEFLTHDEVQALKAM
jgi:hypothetical protein